MLTPRIIGLSLVFSSLPVLADTAWFDENAINDLGTVTVTGNRPQIGEINSDQAATDVSRKQIKKFNRENVADAVNLLPGVTLSAGGARNERTINIRGFDMRQVPLFVDGIPAQVPYDGYVDFGRFTTADLSAIQVTKGFSSNTYGANTLGGAINLVSRKPRKAFEGDVNIGIGVDGSRKLSTNLGTKQNKWYAQVGVSSAKTDGYSLSKDFKPTATQEGGLRNNAYAKDKKASIKLGVTPNASDEYALSYFKQEGEKGNPPSTDPRYARYWKWPRWDAESLHFIGKKALTAHETVKARIYEDRYQNGIDSYTDANYSTVKTSKSKNVGINGKSRYDDKLSGQALELESKRFNRQTLRVSAQQKQDKHIATDTVDLVEQFKDTTQSFAVEDDIQLRDNITLSIGASHHSLKPDYVYKATDAVAKPDKQSANNTQAGLFWDITPTSRVYASVAQKTRLPTLKDRYSLRLGSAIPNPDLKAEQATHYELGYKGKLHDNVELEAAVFQSNTDNLIQKVNNVSDSKYQMQNVGEVRTQGIELSSRAALSPKIEVGGQVTVLNRKNLSSSAKLTGVPKQKVAADITYKPTTRTEAQLVLNHNSSRWDSDSVELAGFNTLDTKFTLKPTRKTTLELGVTNLTDKNYQLSDGFPLPGRTWFSNLNYEF